MQVETEKLLTFKNYYAMRNTLKITGIVSALFTILGASLKVLHYPGAGIFIQLGGILFSLVFLPLLIVLKFKDEEKKVDKFDLSLGFLIAMISFIGVLFKLMHWPWASVLMISGISAFVFAYVPLYYFTRVRREEIRFNTTINSVLMMACGGLIFAMFNLGYGQKITNEEHSLTKLKESSEHLIDEINSFDTISTVNKNQFVKLKQELHEFKVEIQKTNKK